MFKRMSILFFAFLMCSCGGGNSSSSGDEAIAEAIPDCVVVDGRGIFVAEGASCIMPQEIFDNFNVVQFGDLEVGSTLTCMNGLLIFPTDQTSRIRSTDLDFACEGTPFPPRNT